MSNQKPNPKLNNSPYLRLTSAGLQMAGVITAFSYLGYFLDTKFKLVAAKAEEKIMDDPTYPKYKIGG